MAPDTPKPESSSSESSSQASSDSEPGDPPPALEGDSDAFQWFLLGKTVHIVSCLDTGIDISMCRDETGIPFKTAPRSRGSGWSDTIEQHGLCRKCAEPFLMESARTEAEPVRVQEEAPPNASGVEASTATSSSDSDD